jgi:hypothetical protein
MQFKLIIKVSTILACLFAGSSYSYADDRVVNKRDDLSANLGQIMDGDKGARFVFFGKNIDVIWALDDQNNVVDTAWVTKVDGNYLLQWTSGHTHKQEANKIFSYTVTGEIPPLLEKYISFIGKPLTESIGELPKGAKFNPYWFVQFADGSPHWQWRSHGETVVVTDPQGKSITITVDELINNIQKG